MRIAVLDTYYKAFRDSFPIDAASSYDKELRRILDASFATADFYSRGLRTLDWQTLDVIADWTELQSMWARENEFTGSSLEDIAIAQVEAFEPDCVFLQDVSFFSAANLSTLGGKYLLAAQISCPMPSLANVSKLACVFTSFPHFLKRFEELSVRAVYNPLAFEPEIITRLKPGNNPERIHDCVFIGGVGNPSHWKYGMEVLETVAREIPTFKWWGYGLSSLPADSALRGKYQGQNWGLSMFETLLQSRIAVCRHGEVSENYANNMKLFEITGCGALLLTEEKDNLSDFFASDECVTYSSPADAADKIRYYSVHEDERRQIAANGQARCLRDHTYPTRIKTISGVLTDVLAGSLRV